MNSFYNNSWDGYGYVHASFQDINIRKNTVPIGALHLKILSKEILLTIRNNGRRAK